MNDTKFIYYRSLSIFFKYWNKTQNKSKGAKAKATEGKDSF
jgi:hypothetical protein